MDYETLGLNEMKPELKIKILGLNFVIFLVFSLNLFFFKRLNYIDSLSTLSFVLKIYQYIMGEI